MLNITNYYRNADQDYSEVQPETPVIKNWQIKTTREGVEKREPSNTDGGNVNWYNH